MRLLKITYDSYMQWKYNRKCWQDIGLITYAWGWRLKAKP